ncbi:MAG: OstA-like protein [Rikenellaceae bacterium]|nr:OstA-like protein [Rikenellaceae bacterium]
MRRTAIILTLLTAIGVLLFARSGPHALPPEREPEMKIIHLKSDLSGPIAPGDSVLFLVGNVAAQHNGAVITCDSAVRYSDTHVECFGNVLINKNTTYMYGDRADYDGLTNEVKVYSPLVKVIDGDATLYSPNFSFNTKTNVGEFWGGGVLTNRDNVVEAEHGYYFSNEKELVAVKRVEMRNEEYDMRGDSVVYNTATDNAYFFRQTNIWNIDGNYLYGDRGEYSKAEQRYQVTENGYLMTENQELWSDTLDYYRADQYVILRSNLQMDDAEHKTMAFGDYGEYWELTGKGFLTKNPAIVNYDTQNNADTVFMRSDSIYLYLLKIGEPIPNEYAVAEPVADTLAVADADSTAANSTPREMTVGELSEAKRRAIGEGALLDREALTKEQPTELGDAENMPESEEKEGDEGAKVGEIPVADSLQLEQPDSIPSDTLTVKERRAMERAALKAAAREAAQLKRQERAAAKKELLDSIAIVRQQKTNEKLRAMEVRDSIKQAQLRAKARAKMRARLERDRRKGIEYHIDSALLARFDSTLMADERVAERVMERLADSLDSLHRFSLILDTTDSTRVVDSMYRFVKGFRNVKIYRSDFQAICDSLTAQTLDSTAHLYLKPVLWNQTNQITSEVMDIFTSRSQIEHVEFIGEPMMVSQFDTVYYDQITGKDMQAYFADNELYRVDVNSNVRTIFFQKDGVPQQVVMMAVIESGDATFYIVQRQIEKIVYRTNPVWPIYPIDGIPEDVSMYLKGFSWEGDKRPTRRDVFNRTIRPSQRTAAANTDRPEFPIRAWIDRRRAELVDKGQWADRNDELDIETVEWMRSLGFEPQQPR